MHWTDLAEPDIGPAIVERLAADRYISGNVAVVRRSELRSDARQTVVVPVFNQAGFIGRVLAGIVGTISTETDLVVILDGCTDDSEAAVLGYLGSAPLGRLARITVLRAARPMFETRCDNVGFALSRGEHVFDVQADIEICTPAFDRLLTAPMRQRPNIFSVSGRSGKWLGSFVPNAERLRRFPLTAALWKLTGRTSIGPQSEDAIAAAAGFFYTAETVVRGPWAVRRGDLIRLGLLDERYFFLGFDDHDLHARATELGLTCAYVPMLSRPGEGSTRQPRSGLNAEIHAELSARSTEDSGLCRYLRRYKPKVACRKVAFDPASL